MCFTEWADLLVFNGFYGLMGLIWYLDGQQYMRFEMHYLCLIDLARLFYDYVVIIGRIVLGREPGFPQREAFNCKHHKSVKMP